THSAPTYIYTLSLHDALPICYNNYEIALVMNILIIKLGATGDVVRTTPLLRRLSGSVTWITAARNAVLLDGLSDNLRHFSWEAQIGRHTSELQSRFDLVCRLL